jgi:hypothetical protein
LQPGPDRERDDAERRRRLRRRRDRLLNHFVAYFAVLVVAVPANFLTTPDRPWFLLIMVGWGAPLAVHTAWVLGLFDRGSGKK